MVKLLTKTYFRAIVLFSLIIVASLFAIQGRICDVNTKYEGSEPNNHSTQKIECEGPLGIGPEGWTAFFTGGLFVFTIILAIATIKVFLITKKGIEEQGFLARETLTRSRKTSQRQLRAYIFIDQIRLYYPDDDITRMTCAKITFKNFGQTPAYNIKVRTHFELRPFSDETINLVANPNISQSMTHTVVAIAPDGVYSIDNRKIRNYKSDWIEFSKQNRGLFAFGRIDYMDAFDDPHWVEFQHFYDSSAELEFYECIVGNRSDWQPHNEEK